MQAQINAIELILVSRAQSTDVVNSEEQEKVDALLKKVVTRLMTKAKTLYGALR